MRRVVYCDGNADMSLEPIPDGMLTVSIEHDGASLSVCLMASEVKRLRDDLYDMEKDLKVDE